MQISDLPQRIARKIRNENGCWLWTAKRTHEGYGHVRYEGRTRIAYRVTYELLVGPIPDGLVLDHLCVTPACVNPAHLEPVTQAENVRRSAPAQKTACVNGHAYTPENTYRRPGSGAGRRDCRACIRERVRRYKARKTGAAA